MLPNLFCSERLLVVLNPVNSSAGEHAVFISHKAIVTNLKKQLLDCYGAIGVPALCRSCAGYCQHIFADVFADSGLVFSPKYLMRTHQVLEAGSESNSSCGKC